MKEKITQPGESKESVAPKEDITLRDYAQEVAEEMIRVKGLIDLGLAICEPRTVGNKEELTVRDITTEEIIFLLTIRSK